MNGDRTFGRGNAVLALCWLSVLGLAWSAVLGPVLYDLGWIDRHDPDAGIILPLVLGIIGGGALRGHERNGGNGKE